MAFTVLQVLPALESGGVERGTLEIAGALVAAGHRALVVSAGGSLVPALIALGAEHITLPVGAKSLATLSLVAPLRQLLARERVDILHVRSRLPAWIAWLAWRKMNPAIRPRLVTTVHGLYRVGRYSAVMTKGERVIAVSETVRRYLLDNYPRLDPGRIRVIHRGVDPARFPHGYCPSPEWLTKWWQTYPPPAEGYTLVLAGRITRLKGHDDFLTLMAVLRDRGLTVQGLIVGTQDPRKQRYREQLCRQIDRLNLTDQIFFTGPRSDIREVYAAADLVVSLSSQPESFGRTVLEALSLGIPVLGYDHGGVGEILTALYPAGRVPLGNQQELAEKAMTLLQHPPPVPNSTAFPLATMLEQTLELYQELAMSH